MRPVTPQPPVVNNRYGYGAGGYRAFLITAILIGLCIMGLCYGFIRISQTISNISENVTGQDSAGQDTKNSQNIHNISNGYYQGGYRGVLGWYRETVRTGLNPKSPLGEKLSDRM